jgi:hypothetical protein
VCDAIEGAEVHLDAHVKLGLKNSSTDTGCKKCK